MPHRSGFVNIIGSPNVGKSTLMNALVGERLSIMHRKAQTTRHRIMGVVNGPDFQIVYSDTPGILRPAYKLQEAMMGFVMSALEDADVLLYITDPMDSPERNSEILERIGRMATPVVLVINKVDLSDQATVGQLMARWQQQLPQAAVVPASALHRFNVEAILAQILERLPEGPQYFEGDTLTDRTLRFFASEIIREKILTAYQKEIPYSVEVAIEEYAEAKGLDRIRALIVVARESQKSIIIGHQGRMLKRVGTQARKDMEEFLGKKVYLELYVKVDPDWRNDEGKIKRYGYQ